MPKGGQRNFRIPTKSLLIWQLQKEIERLRVQNKREIKRLRQGLMRRIMLCLGQQHS